MENRDSLCEKDGATINIEYDDYRMIFSVISTGHHAEARGDCIVKGQIKWDGCSDFEFYPGGNIHCCGFPDAERLFRIIKKLHSIAVYVIGNADEDLFNLKSEGDRND
ncbi:MAG: hypothetical protein ACPG6R_10865 [Aequoribacter sp.]|uniref:hypothetical protein n=1 Tax=Aequoribacter sp. TaxID=2847771 RepID=UPI003C40D8BE